MIGSFRSGPSFLPRRGILAGGLLVALVLLAVAPSARGASNSARYRFEANKWLSLDLAVDDVRLDVIKFDWPRTRMGMKTGYKATIKVKNGSSHQVGVGLAVALYDEEAKLVGAGTAGTTLGTIDPGATVDFSVDFGHVTQRLEKAGQFQIALETR